MKVTTGWASAGWESTYIGYSLEDMTKWWVAAKWFDERTIYSENERAQMRAEGYALDDPWWSPYCIGEGGYFYEVLDDPAWAFDNYRECKEFCEGTDLMPLNIGDYIRWEDGLIDGHKLRKLSDPIYKASQRFLATRPT